MERQQLREALRELGIHSNSVRAPARALLDASALVRCTDGALRGAFIRNELYSGHASDGWKSDFERRPRWWIITTIETPNGEVCWTHGTRFSSEATVKAEWEETVETMKRDGDFIGDPAKFDGELVLVQP